MPSRGATLAHLLARRSVGSKLLNRSPLEDSSRRFISGISNSSRIFVVGDSEDHEAKQRKAFGAFHRQCYPKRLLHGEGPSDKRSDNFFESADDFERRLFGSLDDGPNVDSFYRKLDKLEKAHGRFNTDSKMNDGGTSRIIDGLGEGFNTLSDKMDEKLKKAARNFVHSDEIDNEDYSFRPDVKFRPGTTYTPRDLDLTKPGIQKSFNRPGFETTTKEVLKKADFRNVRFLANFLTDAGIIIKRSQTKISAKAQRKVAREIKTARAFGLMPFTTMGTKHFVFGKNMKDMDEDYMYNDYSQGMPGATAEPFDDS